MNDFTPHDVLQTRTEILTKKGYSPLKIFDTFEKEQGKKDVVLCAQPDGMKVIVRIGEVRPAGMFVEGYTGRFLRIPRLIERVEASVPYEIEEWIDGIKCFEMVKDSEAVGTLPREFLARLLGAFWEFQEIGTTAGLPAVDVSEKIEKHYSQASALISRPDEVRQAIDTHSAFWRGTFPSKWKFALDNLLVMSDGNIAFIDNAGAGLRFFAYDLGWIIWPRWMHMRTEAYADPQAQVAYLEGFLDLVVETKPERMHIDIDLAEAFWLVVLERTIGALFDVANQTKHMKNAGLAAGDDPIRHDAHVAFVNAICETALQKLKT